MLECVCVSPSCSVLFSSSINSKTCPLIRNDPNSFCHVTVLYGPIREETWALHLTAQSPPPCWAFLARCRRLRRSLRRLCWCAWCWVPWLSFSLLTISWSLLPRTRGRKSEALSVLRVLYPRRGRPLPLMETYHWRFALARRLLPPPGGRGCSVEWWRDA